MNEILHANIFFVIASIATTIFCILVSIILYHVLHIVRTIRRIIERLEVGSQTLAEDVAAMRATLASGGGFVSSLIGSLFGSFTKPRRRSSRRTSDKEEV